MHEYALQAHVRSCRTADGLVLLDLRSGRYLGLGGDDLRCLETVVQGWDIADLPGAVSPDVSRTTTIALAEDLVARGLLMRTAHTTERHESPPSLTAPDDEVTTAEVLSTAQLHKHRIPQLLLAYARAKSLLRWRSLESIAARVRRKSAVNERRRRDSPPSEIRALACAYHRLRPLVLTTRDACLLDSLVLMEFLFQSAMPATWVVGVQTQPFAAHTWVQHGKVVLNDTVDKVLAFTPIMVT